MINVEFPDKTVKQFPKGTSPFDIAKSISEGLSRNALAAKVDNQITDLNKVIQSDKTVKFELLTWNDDEGKSVFWHSSAHLLAEAIQHYYPNSKFAIGPPIENGFYYDIEFPENVSFSSEDFLRIENKIIELAKTKSSFNRTEVSKEYALNFFNQKKNQYKLELIEDLNENNITFYKQGNFTDLCKGPHIPHTGFVKSFKLINVAGAYWRGNEKNKQLTRIYGISFPKKNYLTNICQSMKKRKKGTTDLLVKTWGFSHFQIKLGRGSRSGFQKVQFLGIG